MRLLARLAAAGPPEPPKLLVGFSDITALHLWLQAHGRISVHGPVLTQLGRLPPGTRERLFGLLESTSPAPALSGTLTCVGGVAEGPLLGGNLSVVTRLLGTPFMPALDGAILLLEDQGERPYRLDRMWTHLQLLPCAAGFPIGHGEVNEPVPLGVRVRLDADARSLVFLEAAVAP